MSRVVSKQRPLQQYKWGNHCDSWNLAEEENLSIKQEIIPEGCAEVKHYHQKAQQFFYILKGTATFEIENASTEVNAGEGIHIKAGEKHRIVNNTKAVLEFILCSQPSTVNDRFNCAS